MPSPTNKFTTGILIGIMFLGVTAYYLAFHQNPVLLVGFLLLIILVGLLFTRPELGLPALIIVRPMVDSVGDYRLAVGNASVNIAGALSIIAIGWSLWVLIRRRSPLWDRELFRSMLLVFLLSAASIMYSWDPGATVTEILRISSFLLLFLAARELVTDWAAFRRIGLAFALSFIIPGVVGFGQVLTGHGVTFADSANRAYGTFGTPNVLAFYLVLGISFFLVSWPLLQSRLQYRWPLIGAMGLLLLLTFTRGAWVGLLVSLGLIGFIRFRRYLLGGLFALAVIVAVLPSVSVVTTNVFGLDLRTIPGAKEIIARQADPSSYQWRLDVWTEMGPRFYERPVFGFGLGSFPALRQLQVFDFFQGVGAHNDFLRLLIELGALGLLAYILFLTSIFIHLSRLYRHLRSSPLSLPVLGMIGFTAAFVLMSFFDNLLQSTPVMWAFMVLLGAVLNLAPEIKHKKRSPRTSP